MFGKENYYALVDILIISYGGERYPNFPEKSVVICRRSPRLAIRISSEFPWGPPDPGEESEDQLRARSSDNRDG